jgi:hypothetical protein
VDHFGDDHWPDGGHVVRHAHKQHAEEEENLLVEDWDLGHAQTLGQALLKLWQKGLVLVLLAAEHSE